MPLTPKFRQIPDKKLVGLSATMSLTHNLTTELWSRFMPKRNLIENRVTEDLISLQIYPPRHFDHFDPNAQFIKWALAEVSEFGNLPAGFEKFILKGGHYAVFRHRGFSSDTSIYQYIFGLWLPQSGYKLDERPHFEVLGPNYRNEYPNSEEEIWIPVVPKPVMKRMLERKQ